jgi:adenosylcobyric acid synthase
LSRPGTKATIADLQWVRETGFDVAAKARVEAGGLTLGVCGGCQMLGGAIRDPEGVESPRSIERGLGLLPLETAFARSKRTTRVEAIAERDTWLSPRGSEVRGYEIHHGRTTRPEGEAGAFRVTMRQREEVSELDGAISANGAAIGTMIHGLLENERVRTSLVETLRTRRGWSASVPEDENPTPVDEYDRLADVVRDHLDTTALRRLVFGSP